jgi:hypothetical protein
LCIAFPNLSCPAIEWIVWSFITLTNLVPMFNFGFDYTSTLMIYISLWIVDSTLNQNRLCKKQHKVKTSIKKEMFSKQLVEGYFWKYQKYCWQ